MPTVPTYDSFQATPASVPQAQISAQAQAPQFQNNAAAQAKQTGQAMQQFGGEAGKIALDMANQANETILTDAINQRVQAQQELEYGDGGYTHLRGRDALDRPSGVSLQSEYETKLSKVDGRIRQKVLKNDAQKEAYDNEIANMTAAFSGRVMRHANHEHQVYASSVQKGTMETAANQAVASWGDADVVSESLDVIKIAAHKLGALHGLSEQEINANTLDAVSTTNSAVITNAVDSHKIDYAKQYMELHKDELTQPARHKLRTLIASETNSIEAKHAADSALMGNLTETEALTKLRGIKNIDVSDGAVRRYKEQVASRRAVQARGEKDAADRAKGLLAAGASFDDIPSSVKASMTGSDLLSLRKAADQRGKVDQAAFSADLKVAVERGGVTYDQLDKYRHEKRVSDSDWASATVKLDKANQVRLEGTRVKELVKKAVSLGVPLDPKNKDYQDGVDNLYAEQVGEAPAFSDTSMNASVDLADKTGLIPSQVRSVIRANIRSEDPERAAAAADYIARLNEGASAAYDALPAEEKQFGEMVSSSVRAGMDKKEAVSLARKRLWEMPKDERQMLVSKITSAKARAGIATRLNDLIDSNFDHALFSFQPSATVQISADYQNLVEQHYVDTGDLEVSSKLAERDLKKVWNVTNLNGYQQMMRTPPESVYGNGKDQAWMHSQLKDIQSRLKLPDGERMIFTSDNITSRGVKASYPLWKVDHDGVVKALLNMDNGQQLRWTPDYKKTKQYKATVKSSDAVMMKARTAQDEINSRRSKGSFNLFKMSPTEIEAFIQELK